METNDTIDHLLNCLARHLNSLSKTKQASLGGLLRKNHGDEFIKDIKNRMRLIRRE